MKYRTDIDGLRAIAIIPVVLFHNQMSLFSGGYVGVDVFFVISGYLITRIIQEEINRKQFTIAGFYERRIRRIFPALFTVMLVCSLYAAAYMLPWSFADFGKSMVATTLFVANIYFWKEADYFGAAAESMPLLHTWSLSVEEQFYLLFPLILAWLGRGREGLRQPLLLSLAAASLLLSVWGVHSYPTESFYLIPARAWELLLGALLALGVVPQIGRQALREMASAAGLALILLAVFWFTPATPFPGAAAIIPCLGAALIIHAGVNGSSLAGRLLGTPPLVFFGLISYSLYLWHWPLIVFARQLSLEAGYEVGRWPVILVALLLSVLSWKFVEQPFRKRGAVLERRGIFIAAASVMCVSIVAGYVVRATDGLPGRFGEDLVKFEYDVSEYNFGHCFLAETQSVKDWAGEGCYLQRGKGSNTLLWGDSFAAHYVPGIRGALARIESNVLQYTATGCPPVLQPGSPFHKFCYDFSAQVEQIIREQRIQTVVLAASWFRSFQRGLSYDSVRQTVAQLREMGLEVYLIGQSPRFNDGVQNIDYYATLRGTPLTASTVVVELDVINAKLRGIVGAERFVAPSDFFCSGQLCRFKGEQGLFFWDEGHYTDYGSEQVMQYILSRIKI